MTEIHKYRIGQLPVGELLFKLLIKVSATDTREMRMVTSNNISSLYTYMSTVNSDVSKFNLYVKLNLTGLKVRVEKLDDLMSKLFKGYLVTRYMEFLRYINTYRE